MRFQIDHTDALANSAAKSAGPQTLRATTAGSTNVVELGARVVLQLREPAQLRRFLDGRSLIVSRTITTNTFVLQAPDARTAVREAEALSRVEGVQACYPVFRRSSALHGPYAPPPSETDYLSHWHLEHRVNGQPRGNDINVRAAWPFTRGEGVTVAVVDTGVELDHPELQAAVSNGSHWNFVINNPNGFPVNRSSVGAHGTSVAGLIAASQNDHRTVGVAPSAKLASWAIFDTFGTLASDEQLFDMYQFSSNSVHIQNHSWGAGNGSIGQDGPALLELLGMENAATVGRNGLGSVIVRSAGNDRQLPARADDDGYVSNPFSIGVAAVNVDGKVASYSEPGASVLVGAPSGDFETASVGLFTTDLLGSAGSTQLSFCHPLFPDCPTKDLWDYAFQTGNSGGFNGTSAAAPQISGIAALMLSANPSLGYRDVQQILALSSRHSDRTDPMLHTNGAGFVVSPNVGFGIPDAGIAVRIALDWTPRGELITETVQHSVPAPVLDDSLRVEVAGENLVTGLNSIRCLPGLGLHPDDPTEFLEIVDIGLAGTVPAIDLTNKAALILRGEFDFADKIANAAKAGAAFAVVYNYSTNVNPDLGGDRLNGMAATDDSPIPAVFIGHGDGERLRAYAETNATARMRLRLQSTATTLNVDRTLICEYVGLRVQTDHARRGDLRITLVSPQGTRSVLQASGFDASPGPVDWTYWSTHHFFESSAGTWTVFVTDEAAGVTGSVTHLSLIIRGTEVVDTDRDGLDDTFETTQLAGLQSGPRDDPDGDGSWNALEQALGTRADIKADVVLDLSWWELAGTKRTRLTWPGSTNQMFEVLGGTNVSLMNVISNVPAAFLETEWVGPHYNGEPAQFFRVRGVQ